MITYNSAGALAPRISRYGQRFRAGLGSMIAHPAPLIVPSHEMRGLLGAVFVRAAQVQTLPGYQPGYGGDLPHTEQPTVHQPKPWMRP